VTTEFEGRHYDVLVDIEGQRLSLRADTREHGGWIRDAEEGTPVLLSFAPSDVRLFADDLTDRPQTGLALTGNGSSPTATSSPNATSAVPSEL
jgi:hypothetical protein